MRFNIDKSDYLFVLAGTYDQALFFARENDITDRSRIVSVDSADKLRGISGDGRALYCYGTFYERPNYRALEEIARMQKFSVVYA